MRAAEVAATEAGNFMNELATELRLDGQLMARIGGSNALADLRDLLERRELSARTADSMGRNLQLAENELRKVGSIPPSDTMSGGVLLAVRTLIAETLTFALLRQVNVERCEAAFHLLDRWSPMEWACAMAGEMGEACNAVKKLKRLETGTNTAKDPQTTEEAIAAIGAELADTIIYADLLAARLGIDLAAAVRDKFNAVSDRMNTPIKLPVPKVAG